MDKVQIVNAIFKDVLMIDSDSDLINCAYQIWEPWDSVAHMALVAELEDQLGLLIETDDIIEMSSYTATLQILRKYGIDE